MDVYSRAAGRASQVVTETFSNSFSSAITLLDPSIRQDVYNIYGLVRVADEIVDTHQGSDTATLLNDLEREIDTTLERGFSANVIVHAFCQTAADYAITQDLIAPFFASMRMDVTLKSLTSEQYTTYIHGSAEVIGLMCLKIFTDDAGLYEQLAPGAKALGAAYQKVNFLRDIRDDHTLRGRFYFPGTTFATFDESAKAAVVADIRQDFDAAKAAIAALPPSARFATKLSYDYYLELLDKLERTPVDDLKKTRTSVSGWIKLRYLLRARIGRHAS